MRREKKYPAHQIQRLEKKFLMTRKHPPPPPASRVKWSAPYVKLMKLKMSVMLCFLVIHFYDLKISCCFFF